MKRFGTAWTVFCLFSLSFFIIATASTCLPAEEQAASQTGQEQAESVRDDTETSETTEADTEETENTAEQKSNTKESSEETAEIETMSVSTPEEDTVSQSIEVTTAENITPVGVLSYRIPVKVPRGRMGIEPDIAFVYKSYLKNGWLGVGWDLDMGSIRRSVKRGLDIGGDKVLPYIALEKEANPFLGVRGLRLSLAHRDLFKTQLRAILRTADEFPVRIMFPMVTTLAEWKEATTLLSEARSEVAERGLLLPPKIETGIMIEVPGAALQAEKLARVVDFFSIGSNDLTQYTLATERGNPSVATLFDSLHPAVLRLVQNVVQAAHSHGKWVGICGEIAGDAVAVPLLIGLGLDELSMNVAGIPHIKQIIRTLNFPDLQVLAETSLTLESAEEVRKLLKAFNSKNSEPQ